MAWRNTESRYGSMAILLHWLMFLLIVGLLAVGFFMGNIEDKALKTSIVSLHKSFGLLVLFLACFRILWALRNIHPRLPPHTKMLEKILAHSMHFILYCLMVAMPLTGVLMSCAAGRPPQFFGWFIVNLPVPLDKNLAHTFHEVHEIIAWSMIVLGSLHTLAALFHHYVYKDDVLKRILPKC